MDEINCQDLIGTPFKFGARPGDGSGFLDCYGLVVEMGKRQGKNYPARQFSENHDVIQALMSCQMDEWLPIDNKLGAVVQFKIRRKVCHVGVMINEYEFVHTWEKSGGVCIERIDNWKHRVHGFFEHETCIE